MLVIFSNEMYKNGNIQKLCGFHRPLELFLNAICSHVQLQHNHLHQAVNKLQANLQRCQKSLNLNNYKDSGYKHGESDCNLQPLTIIVTHSIMSLYYVYTFKDD